MKLSTAALVSTFALFRPGGVSSQIVKASFPLLLFSKVAAIKTKQPKPLFDADTAAAGLDQGQGIDIDDFKKNDVDVGDPDPDPAGRWNLESNPHPSSQPSVLRSSKPSLTPSNKSAVPSSSATRLGRLGLFEGEIKEGNAKSGKVGPVICSDSCTMIIEQSLKQLNDLLDQHNNDVVDVEPGDLLGPEDYAIAAGMLKEAIESIGEKNFLDYAEELEEEGKKDGEIKVQSACDEAVADLAGSAIGVFLSLVGVPSRATSRVARVIVRRVMTRQVNSRLREIANEYWTDDSTNLPRMAIGFTRLIVLLAAVLNPAEMFRIIMSNLTFWDAAQFATIGLAQIVLMYASAGSYIAVRLALLGPALVDVVRDSVAVGNSC